MSTAEEKQVPLVRFYEMAQVRMGLEPRVLVAPWQEDVKAEVCQALDAILNGSGFIGSEIANLTETADGRQRSNQSKGNVAADELAKAVNGTDAGVLVLPVKGAGYLDKCLIIKHRGFICGFEIKATSDWQDRDGNRRVLTSSPRKLLRAIADGTLPDPPTHLLGTVLYDPISSVATGVRLDFMEPDSLINVRLEASTSHSLLATGGHHSVLLAPPE